MTPQFELFEPQTGPSGAQVLIVDHYDSFTYNLVQLCLELGAQVQVCRSDKVDPKALLNLGATHWIFSPGPGHPAQAGVRPLLWERALAGSTPPVLGVCLGHQGLCLALGAEVVGAQEILHGKRSVVRHDGEGLFRGCSDALEVVRYHSLVVAAPSLPPSLEACAWAPVGVQGQEELMAVRHRDLSLHGVQFHPESVASQGGLQLMGNFLKL